MAGRANRRALTAAAIGVLLAVGLDCAPRAARACGPFLPEAVFTYELHPDLPLVDLAAGKLGLVQPTWARSYLYVVHHALAGGSFDADARRALDELWRARLGQVPASDAPTAAARWLAARAAVVGEAEAPAIETTRETAPESYEYYDNCLDDAFLTAERTLAARVAAAGRDAPEVRAWIAAQDQVFANCNGTTPVVPPELPASASPAARADRAYQIAAAELYAGRFDDAATRFRAIAADATSPWAPTASYLAARALIRKASLAASAGRAADSALSANAARALDDVLGDAKADALHASARGLRDLVRFRAEPEAQLRTLAGALSVSVQDGGVGRRLIDYTLLLDRDVGTRTKEGAPTGALAATTRDELSDWLFTFQAEDDAARTRATAAWERTHAPVWLVAAIAKARANDAETPALVAAADALDPAHPGFVTVEAHAARLALAGGDRAGAARRLDALLARTDLPRGTVNRLRGFRMAAAETRAEFVRFAPRTVAAITYDVDGNELPDDVGDDAVLRPYVEGRPTFDEDAAYVVDRRLPLATWVPLAADAGLDGELQRRIALAGWVRAALLDDAAAAKPLAARVGALAPELAAEVQAAADAPAAERRFAAVLVLLRHPGLGPFVRSGVGRTSALADLDEFRDNWWCDAANAGVTRPEWAPDSAPGFLSSAERARGDEEWTRLAKLASAPTLLAAEVVAYGRAHPKDPRVPEALHLAVRATRYGCSDAGTSAQSKAAFQLLHKQWPKSEWAAKTKYYF